IVGKKPITAIHWPAYKPKIPADNHTPSADKVVLTSCHAETLLIRSRFCLATTCWLSEGTNTQTKRNKAKVTRVNTPHKRRQSAMLKSHEPPKSATIVAKGI